MLNYDNLNDMEFEALCNDIMSRKLGIPLRRFGPGRDGGVDLTDDATKKNIVVQVKHYRSSPTDQLVRSLKNELPKVKKLQPKKYYICCSRELTAKNISELYQHFGAYMESSWNIVTLTEIDDLLHQDAYRDILKRHFKLWLDDVGILEDIFSNELFVDCEVLLDDIEQQQKFFVQTKAFDQALNALENHQVLCIVGNPGVGKSITSKMLVLHYAASKYQVRYTSDVTDLGSLKRSISQDPNKKEIILLDDCFGQAYFEMRSEQSTALVELIKYVKRRPNKILILNSRVTIFHEAQQRQQKLAQSLDRDDFKVFLLDVNNLSDVEKAKIFYNHISFSGIPDEYLAEIYRDHHYRVIVSHQNYSPRIIEFVCSPRRYHDIEPRHFFDFVMKHLDNPSEMWADEYDNRLRSEDRILLQTIYSLTPTFVKTDLVRHCFEHRIAAIPTIDKTTNQFERSLVRLSEGFVRNLDKTGKHYVSMHNPSINDFLRARFQSHPLERDELIRSICTIAQLRIIPEADRIQFISDLLVSEQIDQLLFRSEQYKHSFVARCIMATGICIDKYKAVFTQYLSQDIVSNYLFFSTLPSENTLFQRLLMQDFWDYYNIGPFLLDANHLWYILLKLSLADAVSFICMLDTYFPSPKPPQYLQQVQLYLQYKLQDVCNVTSDDYIQYVDIETIINAGSYRYIDDVYFDEQWISETIEYDIKRAAYRHIRPILQKLPLEFRSVAHEFTIDSISVVDTSFWQEEYLHDPTAFDISASTDADDECYSPIDAIFER